MTHLFDIGEPDRFRRELVSPEICMIDAGHFALDTKSNEVAAVVRQFMNGFGSRPSGKNSQSI